MPQRTKNFIWFGPSTLSAINAFIRDAGISSQRQTSVSPSAIRNFRAGL